MTAPDYGVLAFAYPTQTMGGQGNLVYLDGRFSPGQNLPVYQRVDKRKPEFVDASLPGISGRVGTIQVIDAVGPTSIGMIMSNTSDIRLGDRLGKADKG